MEQSAWWKEAVVYQIYPRSFMDSNGDGIGDLNGVRSRLGYLQDLGVNVIWLSPFYQSPGVDNGYDISDYEAINPEFGTMEDCDALIAEAHEKGIKVVIDLVVNHTSDQHRWFVESRSSKDNPYRDFYIWRDGVDGLPPNNWGSVFSGPAWKRDEATGQYYLHLFAEGQPDLNWQNPAVRGRVYEMMDWWCRKGVDGFRMDVIGFLNKDQTFPDGAVHGSSPYGDFGPYCVNRPGVHDYIQEMHRRVLSKYDLLTVGEAAGAQVADALLFAGTDRGELNMVFQFERIDAECDGMKWFEKPFDLRTLKSICEKWQTALEGKAWNTLFWENHDQPRIVSRYNGDGAHRVECAKMLAVSLYFQKGTPYIYQGQELGMTNPYFTDIADYRDVESLNAYAELTAGPGDISKEQMMRCLGRVSRDNARTPMQWDATAGAGFTTGTPWIPLNPNYTEINAAAQISDANSVYSFYRKLIRLRKELPVIVYGTFALLEKESPQLMVYTRTLDGTQLLVVCNFFERECDWTVPGAFSGADCILSNYADGETVRQSGRLRPFEAAVFLKRERQ